jgi:hypothetical protein
MSSFLIVSNVESGEHIKVYSLSPLSTILIIVSELSVSKSKLNAKVGFTNPNLYS